MTLGEKQRLFARHVGKLISQAYRMGYEVTLGDAYRDPRAFGKRGTKKPGSYGRASSNHKIRLAIDLNLFKDGEYLTATEDHKRLGEWWEKQHELARWGGRFNDGNHYSFEHGGRR